MTDVKRSLGDLVMSKWLISVGCTLIVVLGFTAGILACGLRMEEGHWTYALDDAYIHMSIARTLAFHGVWGCSPDAWSFCSSSPLWTILLATCFKVLGAHDWIPGVLNVACVFMVLIVMDYILFRSKVPSPWRILAGTGVFLGAPLTVIAATGMEHCLHVMLSVLFVFASLSVFRCGRNTSEGTSGGWLCCLAFFATATRYESVFYIVPVAAILLGFRKWRLAIILLTSGAAPILIHGVCASMHGGFFLPNSLMLKGRFPEHDLIAVIRQVFTLYLGVSLENVHIHILCVLLLLTASVRLIDLEIRLLALVVMVACVAHVTFSFCGRFYRYEIYLMAMGLVVLALAWFPRDHTLWLQKMRTCWCEDRWLFIARFMLIGFFVLPLALRGIWATGRIVRASTNIYEQQEQVARIFSAFDLQGRGLAINDLGVISYRTKVKWVDLWGLGTSSVARLKVDGRYDRQAIADILSAHGVGYLAVFDKWFAPGRELPESLILVATLRNSRNLVCLEDKVMIYATGSAEAAQITAVLRKLPFKLPKGTTLSVIKSEP